MCQRSACLTLWNTSKIRPSNFTYDTQSKIMKRMPIKLMILKKSTSEVSIFLYLTKFQEGFKMSGRAEVWGAPSRNNSQGRIFSNLEHEITKAWRKLGQEDSEEGEWSRECPENVQEIGSTAQDPGPRRLSVKVGDPALVGLGQKKNKTGYDCLGRDLVKLINTSGPQQNRAHTDWEHDIPGKVR